VDLFNAMGNLLLKPFGVPPASEAGHQPHSEDELRELLRESSREGLIEREEQQLSEAALVFGDMRAREGMKPRGEIDLALTTDSPRTIAERAIATGRTRLPVCEPDRRLESAVGRRQRQGSAAADLRGRGEDRCLGAGAAVGAHLGVGPSRRGAA
jgi:CBS domain containing-hemolysin-like protein